ncbi:hypothetical protein ACFXKF_20430 [Streptomyces scopuliridis]|uniref:hypothetical protein n=1 Tax=Streptomyces scopuliridis TaxID=452529 RepID=UPI0036883F6B
MTTRFDEGPEFGPDDPLAVILRPSSDNLGPPAGRYEAIRRAAVRRRLLRTAARAGMVCVVAALVVLPFRLAAPGSSVSPTVPLAPPPVRSPSTSPSPPSPQTPTTPPDPVTPRPDATATPTAEPPSERNSTDAVPRSRQPAEVTRSPSPTAQHSSGPGQVVSGRPPA